MRQHIVMAVVLLLGCGDSNPTGAKEEFQEYIDQLADIGMPTRMTKITDLAASFASFAEPKTDQLMLAELNYIILLIKPFIADLQSVRIDDPELRTIHGKFVQGWKAFLVGCELFELSLRGGHNLAMAELGLESIVEGRMLVDEYETDLVLYVESIGWEP